VDRRRERLYLAALVPETPGFKLVATSEGKPPEPKNGDNAPAAREHRAAGVAHDQPGQAWEGAPALRRAKEYDRLGPRA